MKYFLLIIGITCFCSSYATSKRVEVYSTSQSYWDVVSGETLGEIVTHLLPHNTARRNQLMDEIVNLNPHAFSHGNPNFLKANVRLWLPGHGLSLSKKIDKDRYTIKEFSWGYIQQRKQ